MLRVFRHLLRRAMLRLPIIIHSEGYQDDRGRDHRRTCLRDEPGCEADPLDAPVENDCPPGRDGSLERERKHREAAGNGARATIRL